MPKNNGEYAIQIPRINRAKMLVTVIGCDILVTHNFSDKAKQQMLDKQMKKASTSKKAKDPQQCFDDSLYYLDTDNYDPKKGFGIRAISFKKACVGACRFIDGLPMTQARGLFFIDGAPGTGLLPILDPETGKFAKPIMREDMVRIDGGRTADIRFRGEFTRWRVDLPISYNADAISKDQILNMLNHAGFHGGVGENRPEKSGDTWGRFELQSGKSISGPITDDAVEVAE